MNRYGFVFDLDNFLLPNQVEYNDVIYEVLARIINRALGWRCPYPEELIKRFYEIDTARSGEMGLDMMRFPGSFVELYRQLTEEHGLRYDPKIANECLAVGLDTFNPARYVRQGLIDGAVETLNFLRREGCILVLCTKGDHLVQATKTKVLQLEQFFDAIEIVPTKNAHTFSELFSIFFGHDPDIRLERVWSAGDSYVSDVKPALDAGMRGIWLPSEDRNWSMERRSTDVDFTNVRVIQNVPDIARLWREGMLK